ncbi:UNVERIFIED_CONTAM: hypothetical protein Slati_1692900 [Sesamum latifolium]|uniref:Uncharacterized protein n=1 Tax=Sesamum latifolium TaxID=2727402 RepID=A0AAW2X002_9LAMI
MSFIGAGLFDESLDDIQRYKAEHEREQRDRDGRVRPPLVLRKEGERHRSPPPPWHPRYANYGQGEFGKDSCTAPSRSSKRPNESEAVEVPHGIGKWLFWINRHEG